MPSEFQKALPVLEKIKEAGFEAYFVGALFEMPFSIALSTMWILRRLLIQKRPSRFFREQPISESSMEPSWS
ncbi:polyA polymerase family protein [Streptococcus pneumoniae SP14-BS69]|nr:polyA polymerase family protein [Streptococcus pneumoniae SP14-BS69]